MEGVSGVRKGAWTKEEDVLLRRCIATYGEGKWHQIPLRSGLNRCRKSCRLRWLNYLKPNIKRGEFGEDEVDLMIKLHKLLGNRWSLIAGRLQGRTANDVKNYWNTQLRKKEEACRERETSKFSNSLSKPEVIRPQPRTFSKSFILKCQKARQQELDRRKEKPSISSPSPSQVATAVPQSPENDKEWWETVLAKFVEDEGEGIDSNETISGGGSDLEQPLKSSGEVGGCNLEETGCNWWREMEFDLGVHLFYFNQ